MQQAEKSIVVISRHTKIPNVELFYKHPKMNSYLQPIQ